MEEDRGRGKIRKRRRKSLRVLRVIIIRFFLSIHQSLTKAELALFCQNFNEKPNYELRYRVRKG